MRVRVDRNLTGFNLPGNMDRAERVRFENMLKAFKKLQKMRVWWKSILANARL